MSLYMWYQMDLVLTDMFIFVSQGHVVLNWKARWFVLLPDKLMYYKYEGGKKDSSKRGTIPLAGCVITCPFLEHENRPVSNPDSFCLFTKQQHLEVLRMQVVCLGCQEGHREIILMEYALTCPLFILFPLMLKQVLLGMF